MKEYGYIIYLLFIISWLLQLSGRITILGTIRFDLIILSILTIIAILEINNKALRSNKWPVVLIIYIIITIPFVEWPGTVLKVGLLSFAKAVVFYFFTVLFVYSEKKLKIFLAVYLGCQIFRVIEPVYLHITQNYWGSAASMQGGHELMMRLAGSPSDVVNPNGLAFIIVTTIPFLFYFRTLSLKHKIVFWGLLPAMLYALILTGSRSGLIGLLVFIIYIIYKSKIKYILIPSIMIIAIIIFLNLSPDTQDRYLSLFKSGTKHSLTVQDRINIPMEMSKLILRKPVFGHGISTSIEANANFGTVYILPHNLYVELGIELGLFGMVIFLFYIKSIIIELTKSYNNLKMSFKNNQFMISCTESMLVLLLINIVFTFGSYGLLVPVWYFLGGIIVVMRNIAEEKRYLEIANN